MSAITTHTPERIGAVLALGAALLCAYPALAQQHPFPEEIAASSGPSDSTSPARRIEPPLARSHEREPERRDPAPDWRTFDGSGNHPGVPLMNGTGTVLYRMAEPDYGDGVDTMAGQTRPSARQVSNRLVDQTEDLPNPLRTTDFLWQWGQFLDHDIDLTEGVEPPEWAHIAVPAGDRFFDPNGTGAMVIFFNRSLYDAGTGDAVGNPREQLNEISGWIDASNVYGSDEERAAVLRTVDGTGRLRVQEGDLLPDDESGLPNATGGSSEVMFLAGDVRANEQVALTAMHTLFVREHNRLADEIHRREPRLSGDEVYQRARRIVGAQMQVITYREFLPALLGSGPLPPYRGYDPDLDATIANEFSTAAFRFGHSALSPTLLRLGPDGREIPEGNLALRDAFFTPSRIREEGGIEPLLRGLASQLHQRIDLQVIDDVRNFLFGEPGQGGFDLAALNIQRGRDHGLPDYNTVRQALGLRPARGFAEVTRDRDVQEALAAVYANVDEIDLWVGGLAEDPMPGAHVGPLIFTILQSQFEALRDGDRFWYARTLLPDERRQVEATRLSDIIRRNTTIGPELPDDVFHLPRTGRDAAGGRRR